MIRWLNEECRGSQVFCLLLLFLMLDLTWSLSVSTAIRCFDLDLSEARQAAGWSLLEARTWVRMIRAVAVEELIFRAPLAVLAMPLLHFLKGDRFMTLRTVILLAAAAALSYLFGIAHGGYLCIFNQGISGLLYCLLFLKCGGAAAKLLKPMLATVSVHLSFNSALCALALLMGHTVI